MPPANRPLCDDCGQPADTETGLCLTNPDTGDSLLFCATCADAHVHPERPTMPKHATKKSTTQAGSPPRSKRGTRSVLGESIIFNCRIPITLYDRVETLALALAQPVPVIVRAALLEYLERHKLAEGTPSGLQLVWAEEETSA